MTFNMAVGMVAWMRCRGHAWRAFARRRDPPAMRYGDGIANQPGKG